jgi:hypothetical protein
MGKEEVSLPCPCQESKLSHSLVTVLIELSDEQLYNESHIYDGFVTSSIVQVAVSGLDGWGLNREEIYRDFSPYLEYF